MYIYKITKTTKDNNPNNTTPSNNQPILPTIIEPNSITKVTNCTYESDKMTTNQQTHKLAPTTSLARLLTCTNIHQPKTYKQYMVSKLLPDRLNKHNALLLIYTRQLNNQPVSYTIYIIATMISTPHDNTTIIIPTL